MATASVYDAYGRTMRSAQFFELHLRELLKLYAREMKRAERWTADPNEQNRREAQAAAEKLEFGTAASWAAISAFWSGGSMAPPA